MISEYARALESSNFIRSKLNGAEDPVVGIVLGSGLGDFGNEISNRIEIQYEDIPYFKKTSIEGHDGLLIFGEVNGVRVICMKGRYHFYEGHSMQDVVFPIKVFKLLNIKTLILTNAAGGLNEAYEGGDLVLIRDHMNFFGTNPLIGQNEPEFGPRFPDISQTYTLKLIDAAKAVMRSLNIDVKSGIYAGMTGPNYETLAEVQMLKTLRADLVGASTVPEAIVAAHMGIQVLGISSVTNMAAGLSREPITHQSVIEAANIIKVKLTLFLKALLPVIHS